jgi:hypothetical protein
MQGPGDPTSAQRHASTLSDVRILITIQTATGAADLAFEPQRVVLNTIFGYPLSRISALPTADTQVMAACITPPIS